MGFLKDKSKGKTTMVIKALDSAIASSSGLAEFVGMVVVLAIGAFLGTDISLPKNDHKEPVDETEKKEIVEDNN